MPEPETVYWVEPNGQAHVISQKPITYMLGKKGFFMPPHAAFSDSIPFQAGSHFRSLHVEDRELFVPLLVQAGTNLELYSLLDQLASWFDPIKGEGKIRVVRADGITTREINCRYEHGFEGDEAEEVAGWNWRKLGLTLHANDPYWYANAPIIQTFSEESDVYLNLLQSFSPDGIWLSPTVADVSGHGNNGAVVGSVVFGQAGPILSNTSLTGALFDGNSYEEIPDSPSLQVALDPFTYMIWVRSDAPIGTFINIFGKTHYTAGLLLMYTDGSGHHFQFDITPDQYTHYTSYTAGGPNIDDGAWHLLSVGFDRVNPPSFMVDDIAVTATDNASTDPTGATINPDSTASLVLGTDATNADGGGPPRWPGLLHGAVKVPRFLTVAERQALYQAAVTSSSGLFFPFFPLNLSSSEVFSHTTVINPGDVETFPVWQITGPGEGIALKNLTSGKTMTTNIVLGPGEVLNIDTRPGHIKVVDGVGTNRFGTIGIAPELWSVVPGENIIEVEMDSTTPASAVVVSFTPRYRSA